MTPPPDSGLPGKARQTLARILNHVLAEECMLAATTRDFRWKVTGPNFHSLHKLFDEQRRQIDGWLDQLLARSKAVGVPAEATAAGMGGGPGDGPVMPAHQMIGELLARHEAMAQQLQRDIEACGAGLGDRGTAELLQRLEEFHETTAWMLRMLLPPAGGAGAGTEVGR